MPIMTIRIAVSGIHSMASSTDDQPDTTPDSSELMITGDTERILEGIVGSLPSSTESQVLPSTKSIEKITKTETEMAEEKAEEEKDEEKEKKIGSTLPTHIQTSVAMSEECREALEDIRNKYLTEVPEYLPPSSEKVEEYVDDFLREREVRFPPEVVMLLLMFIMTASTGLGIA